MILVTGATGNVGGEVVRALAEQGQEVSALSRKPPQIPWADGVQSVIGDLGEPDSFAAALPGVTAAFLMAGYPNEADLLRRLAEAGAQQVVLLSANSAVHDDLENVVSRYHVLSERAVRESGLGWTLLRPVSFMSNTLQWTGQLQDGDQVEEPFADVPVAVIDPGDIAAVAAQALITGDHHGATYRLTGPQALYPSDRAQILSTVLGRSIRFVPQDDDTARATLRARMEPPYIDAFFDFFRSGRYDEATLSPVVADVTGRPARTFEHWAREHAGDFAAVSPDH
jgi:uncharacterized protein YbjT (DUF2867 family)